MSAASRVALKRPFTPSVSLSEESKYSASLVLPLDMDLPIFSQIPTCPVSSLAVCLTVFNSFSTKSTVSLFKCILALRLLTSFSAATMASLFFSSPSFLSFWISNSFLTCSSIKALCSSTKSNKRACSLAIFS